MRKRIIGVGLLAVAIVGGSACTPGQIAAAKRAAHRAAPTTTAAWDGPCLETSPGHVRARLTETIDCDLVAPVSLDLTVDQRDWEAHTGSTEGWGGDASLAWATQALEDAGCTVTWVTPYQASGTGCDY